ncbi:MAG: Trm112 family protein [Armatimonadota bacterium]
MAGTSSGIYNTAEASCRVINLGKIDKTLLEILACPVCHGSLQEQEDWLVCDQCRRKYPIRGNIPVLLVEEAVESEEGPASGASQAETTPGPQ